MWGGDLNWVGTKSMQAMAQGGYDYDKEIGEGKRYTTKRDDEIWLKWPRALRTGGWGGGGAGARRRNSTSAWATRTLWRARRSTRCDCMLIHEGQVASALVKPTPMIASDYVMTIVRLGARQRGCTVGARPAETLSEFRRAANEYLKVGTMGAKDELEKSDEIVRGGAPRSSARGMRDARAEGCSDSTSEDGTQHV